MIRDVSALQSSVAGHNWIPVEDGAKLSRDRLEILWDVVLSAGLYIMIVLRILVEVQTEINYRTLLFLK